MFDYSLVKCLSCLLHGQVSQKKSDRFVQCIEKFKYALRTRLPPLVYLALGAKKLWKKTQPSSTGIIRKTCTGHMCLTALTLIAAPIRTSEHSVPCLHHTVRDRPTGRPRPCFRECPPASRRNLRLGPRKLRVKRGGAAQDVAVAVPQLSCNLKCWQRGYCVGQIM